ncbi:F-box domain-containing protein [Mycena kentingensis (nom. inval.)]|nr:F-box domain-containing protein [Mycena kentingensis (nom. inval.)]
MSDFTALLGTNYAPTEAEVVDITAILDRKNAHLCTLDTQIAALQQTMDKILAQRRVLAEDIQAHRALLSPIKRVPVDVLREIFIACMSTKRDCLMSASEAPVLLTRVCSSRSQIAISTPQLWSNVHILDPQLRHLHDFRHAADS